MRHIFKKRKVIRSIHSFMAVVLFMTAVSVLAAGCQKKGDNQGSLSVYQASSVSNQKERYDECVRNLRHYNLLGVEQTIDLNNVYEEGNQLFFHQDMETLRLDQDGNVTISLKGKLADTFGEDYVIDRHVLKMYTVHIGNGSWGQILFLKDDGAIDALLYDQLDSSSLYMADDLGGLKYITDIITSNHSVYAVDMDDNMTNLDMILYDARKH